MNVFQTNGRKANIITVRKKGDKQMIKKLPICDTPAHLQQSFL